jgi:hypothetical protein
LRFIWILLKSLIDDAGAELSASDLTTIQASIWMQLTQDFFAGRRHGRAHGNQLFPETTAASRLSCHFGQ